MSGRHRRGRRNVVLESQKGARKLDRPPRKRGGKATKRGISNEQMCVLVARDRTGQTLDWVPGKGTLTPAAITPAFIAASGAGRLAGLRWPSRVPGLGPANRHHAPGGQSESGHSGARCDPRTERQQLPQPAARLATAVSRRGEPLLEQLPGMALGLRWRPYRNGGRLAAGRTRHAAAAGFNT